MTRDVVTARARWIRRRPVKEIAGILGLKTEGGVYHFARRHGWPRRTAGDTLRRRHNRQELCGLSEADVQPLVPQVVPERRCGGCLGYTDRARCHRCGKALV